MSFFSSQDSGAPKTANAFSLNRGTCQSPAAFDILNLIFEIAGRQNVYLVGDWIPRGHNILCDKLSKYKLAVSSI